MIAFTAYPNEYICRPLFCFWAKGRFCFWVVKLYQIGVVLCDLLASPMVFSTFADFIHLYRYFYHGYCMRIHFIAIGGSVMHNLAVALQSAGHQVTGSDDEIFEPSRSRLAAAGLLPSAEGWDEARVHAGLDAVVLGMHARKDNPELARARALGLKVYTYPEFIFEHARQKQRIVIAGSHGKTTVTSMILHVLGQCGRAFDYVIGALPKGFDSTVRLSSEAPLIVLEGDEYTTSPEDLRPKFVHYHPHIAVITGIAWDHVNVYPRFEDYTGAFARLVGQMPKAGTLIYCEEDALVAKLVRQHRPSEDVNLIAYEAHKAKIIDQQTYLITADSARVPVGFMGEHNLLNVQAALEVCSKVGITRSQFYRAIATYQGAAMRLELLAASDRCRVYRDFAHAPSKLAATVKAVKAQFGKRRLVACMELHTFSSLNKHFLPQYKNSMKAADEAIVYFNPKAVAHKRLEPLEIADIQAAFGDSRLKVFDDSAALAQYLRGQSWSNANLLLMSSGNFDNLPLGQLATELAG